MNFKGQAPSKLEVKLFLILRDKKSPLSVMVFLILRDKPLRCKGLLNSKGQAPSMSGDS
jgi:hypothetical protein